MNKTLSTIAMTLSLALVGVWLSGCGDLCVGGLGDCSKLDQHEKEQDKTKIIALSFNPDSSMFGGYPVQITPSGGAPPYTFTILHPALQGQPLFTPPTVNAAQGVPYTTFSVPKIPPAPYKTDQSGRRYSVIGFQVTDANGKVQKSAINAFVPSQR
jgi:hypothetical protein